MNTSITSGQKKQIGRVVTDAIESALEVLDLTKDEAQSVLEQGDAFKRLLLDEVRKLSKVARYTITVDYGKFVEEMVAAGQYDWKNGDITSKNFPQSNTGVVAVSTVLIHLNKSVSSEVVLAHLEANGLRPATLAELLAFGATYPEIQRQFPVIALGSSWVHSDGNRCVPCLNRANRDRVLYLDWFDGGWGDFCRFLAVRK